MNCKAAKDIDIIEFLKKIGYSAVKVKQDCAWYCSPFRDEKEPSFKVNQVKNLWYDHGIGQGGDLIKLLGLIYNTNEAGALECINSVYVHQDPEVKNTSDNISSSKN